MYTHTHTQTHTQMVRPQFLLQDFSSDSGTANPCVYKRGWVKIGVLTDETSQAHLARWLNIIFAEKEISDYLGQANF